MKFKVAVVIFWLIIAFVVNADTSFLDWTIGLVTGVFAADILIGLADKGRRSLR